MNYESFFTKISSKLPEYEYRVLVLFGLILLILFLFFLKPKLKRIKFRKWKIFKFFSTIFHKTLKNYAIKAFITSFVKVLLKSFYWLLIIALLLLMLGLILASILARPYAHLHVETLDGHIIDPTAQLEITFDVPVHKDIVEINLSPETKGRWEYIGIIDGADFIPYVEKAVFYPEESFYPGEKIVLYLVNMKRIFPKGPPHEQSLETFTPKVPEINTLKPQNGSENIKINENLVIEYDFIIGDFVEFKYEILPEVKFDIELSDDKTKQSLILKENLAQDSEYTIKVFRTIKSINVDTGEVIRASEASEIAQSKFKTVSAPSIKNVSLKGENNRPDVPFEIVFEESMDQESVEENFSVEPDIDGKFDWKDEKTFLFNPNENFNKNTEYQINLSKGILTAFGGVTKEDITLKFKTAGHVRVVQFSPQNGSRNLDPNKVNIVIGFNQEVDHKSAQDHVSISPNPSANFSWDGNKMIVNTAGRLGYNSKYTVTVKPGIKTVYGLDSKDTFKYSFSTKVKTVVLSVPQYYSGESFTCNLAATRMALAYRGLYVSENQIRNNIGIGGNPNSSWVTGYGVHADPIAGYIRNYRRASVKRGWNTPALAREIEKGNPVILFWYNRYSQPKGAFTLDSGATGYKGMHSEVVVGFIGSSSNPTTLIVNDPWRGRLYYSRGLFDSTWSYLNYTAVVVY